MMPKRRLKHIRSGDSQELDITPFMNLMAVLTPFLLATAVFTRLAVLEIYLPPPLDSMEEIVLPDPEKEELILTVSITNRGLIIANGENIVAFIASTDKEQDFGELTRILLRLKARYPEEENAILLSTPMIHYGTVISAMDATRTFVDEKTGIRRELFPIISLGEVR